MGQFGIGQSVSRLEDPRLLRGEGEFIDDTRYPNEAYAHVLRSPRPHADILGIDIAAAQSMSGVLAVLTGDDVVADGLGTLPNIVPRNDRNGSPMFVPPHTILAVGRVRYVGESIALVVAETPEIAAAAADLIIVDESVVASNPITLRPDLPGGAARLYAGASGIDDVLVAGTPVVTDGKFTDHRPGRVLRSGADSR